jgi:thioesterase DpgC
VAELARHTAESERVLADLPPKPDRTTEQQYAVDQALHIGRKARARFIGANALQVYDELTKGRSVHRRLPELAYAAAEMFPGLVPTSAQMDVERTHIQAHKDGREIDQGIFVRGLLRSPQAGEHLIDAMLLPTPRATELLGQFRDTGRLELGTVHLERRGSAGYLTVHNDHCLNAEDNRLIGDMETAVDLVLMDEQTRVGVLRGGVMAHPRYSGRRVFSAGINLTDLYGGQISFLDFLLCRELGYISKIVHGLLTDTAPDAFVHRATQKPWIAAVDSFAIGGGMQLLLVFDHVIAAPDVYFSLPAAQEGIVPGAAGFRLGRLAGDRMARQIILSGRKIWAAEPAAALICDEVVATGDLDDAIASAVSRMDSPAVVANRRMLNLVAEPRDLFRQYMAEFAVTQAIRLYSKDVIDKVGRAWKR